MTASQRVIPVEPFEALLAAVGDILGWLERPDAEMPEDRPLVRDLRAAYRAYVEDAMTASQRVIPVEPLVAGRNESYHDVMRVYVPTLTGDHVDITDAEFAAHFMPAEPFEALLTAVGAEVQEHEEEAQRLGNYGCNCQVCAAYRAYVEAKP